MTFKGCRIIGNGFKIPRNHHVWLPTKPDDNSSFVQ